VVQAVSGYSVTGDPVSFEAHFTIDGDSLIVELYNTSAEATSSPDDMLCSYYFDIVNGAGERPTLTYDGATGQVWQTDRWSEDTMVDASADLRATSAGQHTWEFREMEPTAAPYAGFGLGTVGNSDLSPNNFHGNITGGFNYSLYAGDISTANLDDYPLVKPRAEFMFHGISGFTEADISDVGVFGMGTGPDTLLSTPEPASGLLLGLSALLLRRRR
jgi:hypothetical protein